MPWSKRTKTRAPKGASVKYTDGLYTSIIMRLRDDTGTIPAKINRYKYPAMGPDIERRGRVGKAIYCVKGKQRGHYGKDEGFRFIMVEGIRYIGDMDDAQRIVLKGAA